MNRISRRDFLAGATAAAAGTAAMLRRQSALAAAKPAGQTITAGTDLVSLGNSGIKSTVLGFAPGTRGGREQFQLGQTEFVKLARHAYDRGLRYIDTADMYRTHIFVGFAVKEMPREKLFIQTKTRAKNAQWAKADIERFRRELQTDYLDSLLMHCMQQGSWPQDMRPVMDVLHEAKEKGRVKAVGISCHGWDPLTAAVDVDWIDVQLVRINPFGMKMDGEPKDVAGQIKKMCQKGRGMLGMKVYGEGSCDTIEKRFQSLKYVLGLGCVHAFTIGFSKPEQIDETLQSIEKATAQLAAERGHFPVVV